MSEGEEMSPTTEAGKLLLADYPARYGGALYTDPVSRELTEQAIRAIEAEAAAKERERIRAAVVELPRWDRGHGTEWVDHESVLDIIDGMSE